MNPLRIAYWPTLLAALAALACSSAKPTPSGEGGAYEPRPKGCDLEILQKAPKRTYVELAEFEEHVKAVPPGGAAEVLRDRACALGADALIVTRHIVTNQMGHVFVAGKAIKYVEKPEPPGAEEPAKGEQVPGSVEL